MQYANDNGDNTGLTVMLVERYTCGEVGRTSLRRRGGPRVGRIDVRPPVEAPALVELALNGNRLKMLHSGSINLRRRRVLANEEREYLDRAPYCIMET